MQHVVCPAELEDYREIDRVGFVGLVEILERILEVAGLNAAFGHLLRRPRARDADLRHAQHGPDPIGKFFIGALQDPIEQAAGPFDVVPGQAQETQLGG